MFSPLHQMVCLDISTDVRFAKYYTGVILACKINVPGSWNDSWNTNKIYDKLLHQTPEGYYLIADSAFPHGMSGTKERICALLTVCSTLPDSQAEHNKVLTFNWQVLSYCQTAKWGNHILTTSFGHLHLPLLTWDHTGRAELLENCVWLKNLCTHLISLNEIQSVYMLLWVPNGLDAVWDGLEGRMFSSSTNPCVVCYEAVAA